MSRPVRVKKIKKVLELVFCRCYKAIVADGSATDRGTQPGGNSPFWGVDREQIRMRFLIFGS